MLFKLVVDVALLVTGFGLGRVRNAQKLAAVKAEALKLEAAVVADAKALIAKVKAL